MTQEIEPGDLIRLDNDIRVAVLTHNTSSPWSLIAKGPGWQKHDGSSVNPVPGALVQVYWSGSCGRSNSLSDAWPWERVEFYRVTREAPSRPPAPQPGWVATVTLTFIEEHPTFPCVAFPNGIVEEFPFDAIRALDWQPPPPPPWEPEVGEMADWPHVDVSVTIGAIYKGKALVESASGAVYIADLSDLSPPKGGA